MRPCTGTEALYRPYAHRESKGIALPFLDHDTRRGWVVSITPPAAIYPRERPGTHCTGGWVDLRAGLDSCGKSRPLPGFDPRTVQSIASRHTDWAVTAHLVPLCIVSKFCSVFRQNYQTFLTHSSTFRRWVLSRGDTRGDAWWQKLERLTQITQ